MRKIIPVVAAGVTTLALATGTFAYAAVNSDVTLSIDGRATELRTQGRTVADVLAAEGITVGARDVVAPELDTRIVEDTRIAVQFGRRLEVSIDGAPRSYWTTATSVDQALTTLGIQTSGAKLSTSRSTALGRQGLTMEISTLKRITLDVGGKTRGFATTAETVGEALAAAKVTADADDKVNVGRGAPLADAARIVLTRVDLRTATTTKPIANHTIERRTESLDAGDTELLTEGRDGQRTLTFRVTLHNGKEVARTPTGTKVTRKPVDRVVLVGTREPEPEPEPKPEPAEESTSEPEESGSNDSSSNDSSSNNSSSNNSSSNDSSSNDSSRDDSSSNDSGPAQGVWDRLAGCESGGNWSINTGNGYYGGLQFSLDTWQAYGGSGMPHRNSRGQQIAVAERVLAGQGWGAWPSCSSKLGLR